MRAIVLATALALLAAPAAAGESGPRPDDHAPIGVMGDHLHHAGEFMLSYRYMRMHMGGNRVRSEGVTDSSVLQDFLVTPTRMDMEMHMVGAMYAPTDDVTLMAMVPFVRMDMDHRTRSGSGFTTRDQGLGDVRASALVRLFQNETHQLHLNAGLSAPSGTVRAKDDTPLGRVRLPYPMQIGSGTWDLLPGLTWNARYGDWSTGAQAIGTLRLGRNSEDWRRGHRLDLTGWGARRLLPWLSASARLGYAIWGNVEGQDDALTPSMPLPAPVVPTADPDRQGGHQLDLVLGLNAIVTGGALRGHRFALEVGRPLYQWLDGPKLETDWQLTAGWQLAF